MYILDWIRTVKLDKTITVGHILTFIGFLIAGGGAYAGAMSEMRSVSIRLQVVEKQIESLPQMLISASRQDERIITLRDQFKDKILDQGKVIEDVQKRLRVAEVELSRLRTPKEGKGE